tara:strand:+ start:178 stop:432 length:255 start_codon:yes stop_codon:yes gene_type:complete
MDENVQNEAQFVEEIKSVIADNVLGVSNKVIQSAYSYLKKNDCLNLENDDKIQAFFVNKIPQVLSKEVSKELETVLGLNLSIEE